MASSSEVRKGLWKPPHSMDFHGVRGARGIPRPGFLDCVWASVSQPVLVTIRSLLDCENPWESHTKSSPYDHQPTPGNFALLNWSTLEVWCFKDPSKWLQMLGREVVFLAMYMISPVSVSELSHRASEVEKFGLSPNPDGWNHLKATFFFGKPTNSQSYCK